MINDLNRSGSRLLGEPEPGDLLLGEGEPIDAAIAAMANVWPTGVPTPAAWHDLDRPVTRNVDPRTPSLLIRLPVTEPLPAANWSASVDEFFASGRKRKDELFADDDFWSDLVPATK